MARQKGDPQDAVETGTPESKTPTLQIYPESPEQELKWEKEALEIMSVPPVFDDVDFFGNSDHTRAKAEGKWGIIGRDGKWIIPPDFEDVTVFGAGLAYARSGGKWGIINKKGAWVLEPFLDKENDPSHFPVVRVGEKKGIITQKGRWFLEPVFDVIWDTAFGGRSGFYTEKDGRCSMIDHKGNWIFEQKFEKLGKSLIDLTMAKSGGKWGLVDDEFNWVIEPEFEDFVRFEDGLGYAKADGKWGLIDVKGNWVAKPEYDKIERYMNDFITVVKGDKIGLFDTKGNLVMEPRLEECYSSWWEGLTRVKINGKWGCIDRNGNVSIRVEFEELGVFQEGFARAKENGKWGFIDHRGNWKIEPLFERADPFEKNSFGVYSIVACSGKSGLIDREGKWILEPVYDKIHPFFKEGFFMVKMDGKYNFIDSSGKLLSDTGFEKGFPFDNGVAVVKKIGGQWGTIDIYGDWIVKPVFRSVKETPKGEDKDGERDIFDTVLGYGLKTDCLTPQDLIDGPLFDETGAFGMSLIPVKAGEKYGFIDCEHKWAIKPVLEGFSRNYSDQYVRVIFKGKYGFMRFPEPKERNGKAGRTQGS